MSGHLADIALLAGDVARRIALVPSLGALLLALPIGYLLEWAFGSHGRRADRLNWLFAPFYLFGQVLSALALFQTLGALRDSLGFGHLFDVQVGGEGIPGTAAALFVFTLVLDASLFVSHRLQHAVAFLWQGHRLHHSDPLVDVSTTLRLHPTDLISGNIIVTAVFVFVLPLPHFADPAILMVPFSWLYYIHLDIDIRHGCLWWLITSPYYHRVHHERAGGGGCNYATFFPLFDIICRTARSPTDRHTATVGLASWAPVTVAEMLAEPIGRIVRLLNRRLVRTAHSDATGSALRRQARPPI